MKDKIMKLIEEYANTHDLAKECGSEYIYQSDTARTDAINLVSDIFDLYANMQGNNMEHELKRLQADIADLQPTQMSGANGWIPIEDELPENNKYILLSFANFSVPGVGRYEEDEEGGAFYIGDDTDTCLSQDVIVNAWQPLPSVYEEE